MCEPTTIAAGAAILGTAVSAYGAVRQGQAQSEAAAQRAQQDRTNAEIAGYNAQVASDAQAQKTQAIEREGTLRAGAQRAALGAAGVTLDGGSSLDVLSATAENTGRAASSSQAQGALTEYGYRTQQMNYVTQAGFDQAASDNYSTAGFINGTGSLLSSAGQVAPRWYQLYGPPKPDTTGMGTYMGGLY